MLHPSKWKDDKTVEQCSRCATVFTFLRRRHHCRHCGGVFCGPCTAQRLWLRPWSGATVNVSVAREADTSSSTLHTPRHIFKNSSSFPWESAERAEVNNEFRTSLEQSTTSFTTAGAKSPSPHAFLRAPTPAGATPVDASLLDKSEIDTRAGSLAIAAAASEGDDRTKMDVAHGSRGSAVGLTSFSTEMGSRVENSSNSAPQPDTNDCFISIPSPTVMQVQQQQQHQRQEWTTTSVNVSATASDLSQSIRESVNRILMPISIGAVSASTVDCPQLSDGFHNSNVCASSPNTVTGDVTPKTWATPSAASGLDRTASPSYQWPRVASSGTCSGKASLEALLRGKSDGEVRTTLSQVSPAPLVNEAASSGQQSSFFQTSTRLEAAVAAANASGRRNKNVDASLYADAGYRTEVDQLRVTWYLCRVCSGCYDALLSAIRGANEHSPLLTHQRDAINLTDSTTAVREAPTAAPPLWEYVRFSSSTTTHHAQSDMQSSQQQQRSADISANTNITPPGLSSPIAAKPLLTSALAHLRTFVSLPASPVTSFARIASPIEVNPAAASGGPPTDHNASPLSPPALRPRDLRCARDSSSTAYAPQTVNCSTTGQVDNKMLSPMMGAPGLPARLKGLATGPTTSTACTTAVTAASLPSDGSHYSSPTSAVHHCEASVLSVSSASFQQLSLQSMEVTSPKQQQQQRVPRVAVPPSCRRLISIVNSTGHVRQAVAIAQRRRRVAVILIDEREAADVDNRSASLSRYVREEGTNVNETRVGVQQQRQLPPTAPGTANAIVNEATPMSFSPCQSPTGTNTTASNFDDMKHRMQGRPQQRGPTRCAAQIATPVGVALSYEQQTSFTNSPTAAELNRKPCDPSDSEGATRSKTNEASCHLHLSIVVDAEEDSDGALQGLSAVEWLLPMLPLEAAAAGPVNGNENTSLSAVINVGDRANDAALSPTTVLRASVTRETSGLLSDPASTVTSCPISCADGSTANGSTSTPNHGAMSGSATSANASAPAVNHHHHRHCLLPAVTVSAESGAYVLNALFRELGAATHMSTTPATPVVNMLTPTSSAATAAASGAGHFPSLNSGSSSTNALFMDSPFVNGVPQSGWGTGQESYAAQRQALIRGLLHRQQRAALAAAAVATIANATTSIGSAAMASPPVSPSSSNYVLNNSNSTFVSSPSATATTPYTGGVPVTPTRERVTASVNIYFQLRSPTDNCVVMPLPPATTTAATASTSATRLSISIVPVTTQVEMIGVPIDATSTSANTSPKSLLSSTNGFTSQRSIPTTNINNSSNGAGVPGVTRPLTLADFLSQLAKFSTNVDGYLIIVLRRGSGSNNSSNCSNRCNCASNTSPTLNTAAAATAAYESPHILSASRRARRNIKNDTVVADATTRLSEHVSQLQKRGVRANNAQLAEEGDTHSRTASYNLSHSVSLSGGPPLAASAVADGSAAINFVEGGMARGHERDTSSSSSSSSSARRCQRVAEPFGGPQLRLLYQQLQSCGVAQPALSVVDVYDSSSSSSNSNSDVEKLPESALNCVSPLNERDNAQQYDYVINQQHNSNTYNVSLNDRPPAAVTGAPASPAETWHGSFSSPINTAFSPSAASPVSSHTSSVHLLALAPHKAPTLMGGDSSAGKSGGSGRLDKAMLPSSVLATRGGVILTDSATSAAATATNTDPMGRCTNCNNTEAHELRCLAAQEHAMYSLRAAARQLGLPVSTMVYPTRTAAVQTGNASGVFSVESPLRNSNIRNAGNGGSSGSSAVSNALLSRGLESLAATMVYRDLSAQQ